MHCSSPGTSYECFHTSMIREVTVSEKFPVSPFSSRDEVDVLEAESVSFWIVLHTSETFSWGLINIHVNFCKDMKYHFLLQRFSA